MSRMMECVMLFMALMLLSIANRHGDVVELQLRKGIRF